MYMNPLKSIFQGRLFKIINVIHVTKNVMLPRKTFLRKHLIISLFIFRECASIMISLKMKKSIPDTHFPLN